MPELPEVETVCQNLLPYLQGHTIEKITLRRENLRFAFAPDFAKHLQGRTITRLARRAKFLVAELDNDTDWIMHLGMSGRFLTKKKPYQPSKHDHVLIDMCQGNTQIIYNDPRRFGFMDLCPRKPQQCKWRKNLGPEPLGNAWQGKDLHDVLQNSRAPIKTALLNQSVVAGLGNIYVCEILYRASLSPFRLANTLQAQDCDTVVQVTRDVLRKAILVGGSSLKDFTHTNGEAGYFQHEFDVYGRENQSCQTPKCTAHIKRQAQAGRSSFYCPQCQN